jgi:hypothetical protein
MAGTELTALHRAGGKPGVAVPIQLLPPCLFSSVHTLLPSCFLGPACNTALQLWWPTAPPLPSKRRQPLLAPQQLWLIANALHSGMFAGLWVSPVARSTRQVEREEKKGPHSCQNIAGMRGKLSGKLKRFHAPALLLGLLGTWARSLKAEPAGGCPSPSEAPFTDPEP